MSANHGSGRKAGQVGQNGIRRLALIERDLSEGPEGVLGFGITTSGVQVSPTGPQLPYPVDKRLHQTQNGITKRNRLLAASDWSPGAGQLSSCPHHPKHGANNIRIGYLESTRGRHLRWLRNTGRRNTHFGLRGTDSSCSEEHRNHHSRGHGREMWS